MSLPDEFIWGVDYGMARSHKDTVRVVEFGGGYEQRAHDGVNRNPRVADIAASNRDLAEADAIDAFLESRGGVVSFLWTPPTPGAKQGLWKCPMGGLKRTETEYGSTVTAQFREVFE